MCQNTQCITICCIWDCVYADWTESHDDSSPLMKVPTMDDVSIRTGPWSNGRGLPGLMNHVFI